MPGRADDGEDATHKIDIHGAWQYESINQSAMVYVELQYRYTSALHMIFFCTGTI